MINKLALKLFYMASVMFSATYKSNGIKEAVADVYLNKVSVKLTYFDIPL